MTEESAKLIEEPIKILELSVPADEGQLSRVRDFVVTVCDSAGFSPRETNNTKLAVDEACTNIIKHAYSKVSGDIKIRAQIYTGHAEFMIRDTGEHFDFASIQDPDLDQYVESGRKGGLGVFLINRLMDTVDYHTTHTGNELILTKKSRAALAGVLPRQVTWRNSLRFKFTLRAGLGLFFLVTAIWAFIFARQTSSINDQKSMQWVEKKRIASNLANRSRELLIQPEAFSVEQTKLGAYLSRILASDEGLAYVRVLDRSGKILSSGDVDEIFTKYQAPEGELLLRDENGVSWMRFRSGQQMIRDIYYPVMMQGAVGGTGRNLGGVHVGVYESVVEEAVSDPRLTTTFLIVTIFLIGILLIMGLVSVFVKPIQVLTDGVRAIGEGTLDGQISVDGPAEIGAIASVFNEITTKFRKAQESILEQEKFHKEMEVAKQIQHSLLPKRLPDVSGYDIAPYYQAAAEVGGDYYDFVQVDADTVGIVVADVSGKGVPGSLVMTMIRTALRMEARGNKNASDVMSKMNDFVTDDMRKGMFVTMFYVILDSKNRVVSYASAGHNPMVLYRRESNETYFLNPKGFPVGISLPDEELFRQSISLEKIKLKKDDMLLIYTDGVTEAMNETREQYGEERLLDLIKQYGHLHPRDFITKLETDIRSFTGGHPQNDDITVVAVKEKLTADEVLSGLRRKLIDMVDVAGLSVKEACEKMKVSPATYYRYKKRLDLLGERGLKNKVLRDDVKLKRVSLEERKEILGILQKHPEFGAKRITSEFNINKDPEQMLTERMVYDELKRLNLNTRELRLDYLRRNRLISDEELEKPVERPEKELVEEFLEEVSSTGVEAGSMDEAYTPSGIESVGGAPPIEYEAKGDLGIAFRKLEGNVTEFSVEGHLDSVSSSAFEKKMKDVIESGNFNIVVDLSKVSYISSGGWGIFTGEVRRLRQRGGDVVLVGMTSDVYDVYELLGFAEILRSFPTMEEAVRYFQLPTEERLEKAAELTPGGTTAGLTGLTPMPDEIAEEIPGESYIPEWESLKIEATTAGDAGDIAVLLLKGIIDTVSAENLRKVLERVISRGLNKIVVDMSLIEYVSSGGWGAFTERLREVRRAGGDIKLFGMDPDVYYVFTMLGFNIVLSSFDIMREAIEDFKREPGKPIVMPSPPPSGEIPVTDEKLAFQEEEIPADVASEGEPVSGYPPDVGGLGERSSEDLVSWETTPEGVLVSYLKGTIEASAVVIIENEIDHHLSSNPEMILFDLDGVTYISSTGWGLFAKCLEQCSSWGGIVALSSMKENLYEIYRYLEFQSIIPTYSSKAEAVRHLSDLRKEAASSAEPAGLATEEKPWITEEPREDEMAAEEEMASVDDILGVSTTRDALQSDTDAEKEIEEVSQQALEKDVLSDEAERPLQDDERLADDETKWEKKPVEPSGLPPLTPPEEKDIGVTGEAPAVDIHSAVSDKNISEDEKLRKMGWEKYGRKLRHRSR